MSRWLALGCLGSLVFLGLAGWAAYSFLIRPAQALVNDFRQIVLLDRQVERQTAFTPPANNQLTSEQVQRLLQVQRTVRQQLGERYQRVEARLSQLANQQVGQLTLDYRSVLDLFRDSRGLVLDGKRMQVEALNAQGFSLEEYHWVRGQVYAALGLGVPNLDPGEILRQIGTGNFNPRVDLLVVAAPAANVQLVEPFRQELKAYYPLTWFGL